ncbi:hypothetical protein EV284_0218 [Streptomyces sp. BK022]|uniref:hypothetical protein n=1 Tax=Streptomyces sp. BK022 TaxID=2512123 RepID=UPI0010E1FAC7|nr:hypothetical protein EV284_0218 [Streptomyces sp. BK022]
MEEGDLAAGKTIAAEREAWLVFEDEAGQSLTPPRARTWGRRGCTPVVKVRGRGSWRKDQPKGFGWRDLRDLIIRARIQLGGPSVLIWDNVRLHLTKPLRELIEANSEWLTVFQLPAYAP